MTNSFFDRKKSDQPSLSARTMGNNPFGAHRNSTDCTFRRKKDFNLPFMKLEHKLRTVLPKFSPDQDEVIRESLVSERASSCDSSKHFIMDFDEYKKIKGSRSNLIANAVIPGYSKEVRRSSVGADRRRSDAVIIDGDTETNFDQVIFRVET